MLVLERYVNRVGNGKQGRYLQIGFSGSRVLSPVCCLESCDLDTDSYRDGNRKQLRLWRMSTDINLKVSFEDLEG
jgi:hypothetical protein